LGFDPALQKGMRAEVNDEMLDAQSIFIYKAIKGCNPTLQILTELNYSSNTEFLQQKSDSMSEINFTKLYCAGEVYISTVIDTLTAQAYYNPHIVTVLQ